ncbi:MAG: arginine--tRNA ligase [Vicingaceae bacterium]|nr:MAG: arginine--tRNA ligase [Vicingaceae bacterium]
MKRLADQLQKHLLEIIHQQYNVNLEPSSIQIEQTNPAFEGELTWVIFPVLKLLKSSPQSVGETVGKILIEKYPGFYQKFEVVKGFLNLSFTDHALVDAMPDKISKSDVTADTLMIEFASPNTNKPLHLGHIRNILIGWSFSQLLEWKGHKVIKANLINDRGIHICKSMIAWKLFANGETPESSGMKGDHLVGKYYVMFDQTYKQQVEEGMKNGLSKEEAEQQAPIMLRARELLKKWEEGDEETLQLWKMMNSWVYKGFDETFEKLGVSFDEIYYESDTYLLGKKAVNEGLEKGIFYKKEDGSVWCDLTAEGLDHKLLLRSDGTSVYITQDIGTAIERFEKHPGLKGIIYVVGNEQEYHFKVLFAILKKLGYSWADRCYHLSYGMVELPEGKMKSREGTVVDADDLIEKMIQQAAETAQNLGKIDDLDDNQRRKLYFQIGMGALKYFILKVDPKKNMIFNPKESIDLNGHTGPFIQYTHARICSLLKKAGWNLENESIFIDKNLSFHLTPEERSLVKKMIQFNEIIDESVATYNISILANYIYDLSKTYNHFYQTIPILKESNEAKRNYRLKISAITAAIIKNGLNILGIEAPEKM